MSDRVILCCQEKELSHVGGFQQKNHLECLMTKFLSWFKTCFSFLIIPIGLRGACAYRVLRGRARFMQLGLNGFDCKFIRMNQSSFIHVETERRKKEDVFGKLKSWIET